ncbi:hypothetical protein E4U25_005006, partial [Claviceps purpurea]
VKVSMAVYLILISCRNEASIKLSLRHVTVSRLMIANSIKTPATVSRSKGDPTEETAWGHDHLASIDQFDLSSSLSGGLIPA